MTQLAALLLLLLAQPVASQEAPSNRLWWADFELAGPLQGLRVDCAADGELRLALGLRQGERRVLALPLPLFSPLGSAGLDGMPFEIKAQGDGSARFLGWVESQPNAQFEALPAGLRARPRPPAGRPQLSPSPALAAFFLGSMLLVFALRKRARWSLPAAACLGLGLAWLGAGQGLAANTTSLLELDFDAQAAVRVQAAMGHLELPAWRLELQPPHAAVRLELRLEGDRLLGQASAEGLPMVGHSRAQRVRWDGSGSPVGPLEQSWVRDSAGQWRSHGAWAAGGELGPSEPGGGAAPGWLAAGLAPGRGVLLGRMAGQDGVWIRAFGFKPR